VELYSLRFQIEFNFRDAKQYWGLEDFMNVSSTAVTNAVNLAFFMVNFSHQLLQKCRCRYHKDLSILDLKAFYRGFRYVDEIMKMLPEKPEAIFINRLYFQVANLGAIHPNQCEQYGNEIRKTIKKLCFVLSKFLTRSTFYGLFLTKVLFKMNILRNLPIHQK
jgi:hypothetical protein